MNRKGLTMAETTTPNKVKEAGKPQPASFSELAGQTSGEGQNSTEKNKPPEKTGSQAGANDASTNSKSTDAGTNSTQNQPPKKDDLPELTPEQISALFEKQGIKFEGFDKLKEKLDTPAATPPKKELTKEEKEAKDKEFEMRVINSYITNDGKIEDYTALKRIIESDPKDLSLSETKHELKKDGFTDDEINEIIKQRYFQISDDEITQFEDETDREFAKRKREYGSKKLGAKSTALIDRAKGILKDLHDAVKAEDLIAEKEVEFSSNVDDHFKKVSRKISFQLGEEAGQPIAPVEFEIQEADIEEVQSTLKDPVKRNKLFYNEGTNTLNLQNISEVLLRNKILEKAIVKAYQDASKRTTDEVKKVFGSNAHDVGLSGNGANTANNANGTGKLKSFGKTQVAKAGDSGRKYTSN